MDQVRHFILVSSDEEVTNSYEQHLEILLRCTPCSLLLGCPTNPGYKLFSPLRYVYSDACDLKKIFEPR